MKLRIKGNSIRLRLLRSEVEQLAERGSISDEVEFGTDALRYSVLLSAAAELVRATFENNEIAVVIPESEGRNWAANDDVGFEIEQPTGEGRTLTILVEKDFVCVDRPNDPDRDDGFPNPNTSC